MQFLKDIFYLFYPNLCVTCEKILLQNEKIVCTQCRHDLPLICYKNFRENKITKSFYGKIPIEKAMSFLIFRKEGKTKELIHELKYKGNQEIGTFIGNWFGHELKESNQFNDVDVIIPVPLHPAKLKKRGYNQLTTFGTKLSEILNIPYNSTLLIKTSNTKTQTFKQRFERFNNANTKFDVLDKNFLENKHILLIDDVITTGATIESCSKELLKISNVKISVVTMAYTERW